MTLTLGLDIGTYESKGVLVDVADGRIVAAASRPHRMLVPRPGWAEHRAEEDWWGAFHAITRTLLATPGVRAADIGAVATSAIGPCMLPVSASGQALMNGVLYGVDTRAAAQIDALNARLSREAILARCGNALTSQSVGPKILWLAENRPDIFDAAASVMTSTSFVTYRLTGETVIDHYTAANFSPLYDVNTQDWADDLCAGIIDRTRLPRLLWSTEIAGRVTPEAAAATGLLAGTPVTCGTIDAAAEAVSVGVGRPGEMMLMYGSTIFIIQVTDRPVRDARLWYAPWLYPGSHASMAGLATSGTLTHWFRDELAYGADFQALAAEAAESPKGAKGILCLPHFSGERTPLHDPAARGAFFGLDLTHRRGDLYRALLEGIASGTALVLETLAELDIAPGRVLAVGGGTRNQVWLQATSDIAGVAQVVPQQAMGAAFGDAFLAALAIGAVPAEAIARWNPPSRVVEPEEAPVYARQYPLWKDLYRQTRDISHRLGAAG